MDLPPHLIAGGRAAGLTENAGGPAHNIALVGQPDLSLKNLNTPLEPAPIPLSVFNAEGRGPQLPQAAVVDMVQALHENAAQPARFQQVLNSAAHSAAPGNGPDSVFPIQEARAGPLAYNGGILQMTEDLKPAEALQSGPSLLQPGTCKSVQVNHKTPQKRQAVGGL